MKDWSRDNLVSLKYWDQAINYLIFQDADPFEESPLMIKLRSHDGTEK